VAEPQKPPRESPAEPLIRNISDTARWVAVYRAQETERADAVFRDPYARRLAGDRGEQIARSMPLGQDSSWSMVTRTFLIDALVREQVQAGIDTVVNLAAGLDSRPYRMDLPGTLRWIEIDLPEILDYKEQVLQGEKPVCHLERIRLNLADAAARKQAFTRIGAAANKALVITEGLLIYLTSEAVGELARDLAAVATFQAWIIDIASPGLLRMLAKRMASQLREAAPFRFAPAEGPKFFEQFGWTVTDVRSLLKNASALKRLPWLLRFFAMLPETEKSRRNRPWSGVCLLRKG
jgi:methyltransferase (TIGR00027 family)